MSVVLTLLALVGFVILTAGTALFVAAEFSLTALERSMRRMLCSICGSLAANGGGKYLPTYVRRVLAVS
jgi:hypothetical protein